MNELESDFPTISCPKNNVKSFKLVVILLCVAVSIYQ